MSTDLVLQAESLTRAEAQSIAALAGASRLSAIAAGHAAWRLHDVNPALRQAVAAACAARHCDYAFVPAKRSWRDIGLIAMDMDSTLITIECIDEIADFVGRKAEVADVTERAMRGEIDWPQSLTQRVALLRGLEESALAAVYDQRLTLTPGAEALVAFAKRHGIQLLLVSGGFTYFTDRLKARLALDHAFSNVLEIEGGRLTGRVTGALCDAAAKARHLIETRDAAGLAVHQTLAIGDGANDLPMMAAAGFSIGFHAKPKVQDEASAAINHGGLERVIALFQAGDATW
ncbi:MAG: phosphoserine phosphatase SerB [Betaproteobacteria bacterium]|nr:phosphoserine phosphatase SerB [Betaproteobacteria bacterium]